MDRREILKDAIELIFIVERRGGHLFVDYQPHVDLLNVRYFKTGWRKASDDPTQTHSLWFENGDIENKWNEIKGKILYKN